MLVGLTSQQIQAECLAAGLAATRNNGSVRSFCPLCSGEFTSTWVKDQGSQIECDGGCDPSRIADALYSRRVLRGRITADTPDGTATAETAGLVFKTPAEIRAETPPNPEWIVDGLLARGAITLLAGKPKVGKSTLSFDLVRAVTGGLLRFLGRDTDIGTVVYVSEEAAGTLLPKIPEDDDRLRILTRDAAWPRPPWEQLVDQATAYAIEQNACALIIDTLPYWAALGPDKEKDAGAAQAALEPLHAATRGGLAVLLPMHTRKGGGEDGDAIRGSTAFAGGADIILELERPTGQNPPPRQRVLAALSRYPQTPGVLVIEHDLETGWSVVGEGQDRRDSRAVADKVALLNELPASPPGLTRKDLENALEAPHQQWSRTLQQLIDAGDVKRDGEGKKGDPYRYRILRNAQDAHQAQKLRTTPPEAREISAAHPPRDAAENEPGPILRNETHSAATPDEEAEALSLLTRHGEDG